MSEKSMAYIDEEIIKNTRFRGGKNKAKKS